MLIDTMRDDLLRGVARYQHVQTVAASTWVVVHNLNTSVISCDCQIVHEGTLTKVIPHGVEIVDDNTVNILWTIPRTGLARIS